MVKVYSWENMPREKIRPGVSRAGFRGDNSLLVMNWAEPGNEPRPHSHPFDQVACILKGRVRFTVGDEVVEVGAGEVIHIPAGVVHFGEVIGDEPAVNLDVFGVVRPDYLHLTEHQPGDWDRAAEEPRDK